MDLRALLDGLSARVVGDAAGGANVPSPFPASTVKVLFNPLAVTRSVFPSALKSPAAIDTAPPPAATFTADGRHLFINVQYPGLTCVITGPWHSA